MSTPNTEEEAALTIERVEEQEARVEEIRGRLRWITGRKGELTDGLGQLHAEGRGQSQEAGKLRDERRELLAEEEELQAALPVLAGRISGGRERACRAEAESRVREIARSLSGNTGEQRSRLRRLIDAADAFVKASEQVTGAFKAQTALQAEEAALRRRFPDLPETSPKLLRGPGREEAVEGVQVRVRNALNFPHRARFASEFPTDAPGRRILEAAGPTDAERQEADRVERKRRETEAAERQALKSIDGEIQRVSALPSEVSVSGGRF